MSEALLWQRMARNLKPWSAHLTRVENRAGTGEGDVNFCCDGVEGWCELKYKAALPARIRTPLFTSGGLRAEQIAWTVRRARAGGNVWVLAHVERWLLLVHGKWATIFNDMPLNDMVRAAAYSQRGNQDWDALARILFNKE